MIDRNYPPFTLKAFVPHLYAEDKFHDECGVFGIFKYPESAAHTVLGLHALQHRGQEAAGVVSCDNSQF
ncbi:Amidophosphoribosyltransferase, partial [hydrothermal vent metagenome]